MKTLSGTLTTEIAAAQSGWCECVEITLKSAITTPFGSTSVLRVTSNPGGLPSFLSNAWTFWPFKRDVIKGDRKTTNDKLGIAFSNVTGEWATMLDAVDWSDVPVTIYKVATSAGNDYVTLFTGLIDSASITLESIQFTVSNSLGSLSTVAPRENMHQNCRFSWADDQCTMLRYRTENYAAKTLDAACTTTRLKDTGFTEDTGTAASYGTDLVNALADAAITESNFYGGYTNQAVTLVDGADGYKVFSLRPNTLKIGDIITVSASVFPSPLVAATNYYIQSEPSDGYWGLSATLGGARISITTAGTLVKISTVTTYKGKDLKSSNAGFWQLSSNADWGTISHAYWQIPDAQAGVANAALKPYVQFDFGSAKTPRLWRISSVSDESRLEDLARLVVFFSSSDAATWTHEGYFELPPVGGTLHECLIPKASTKRYWRICIRSKWATSFSAKMLAEVRAYEESRHWWRGGLVKFGAATSTVALRNLVRPVLESYSGEVVVPLLPVAPASGDTIVIERGCNRSFNACCERRNWENFGGFTDLPNQTIIR